MTAKEKFEKRLVELGLMDEWKQQCGYGKVGKELEDGRIVILVHEFDGDGYSEETFPPYNILREDEKFQRECWKEFSVHDNGEFVKDLACWLRKCTDKCPLYPVEIFFVADHLSEGSVDFTDDPVEEPEEKAESKVYEKWFGETLDNLVNCAVDSIFNQKQALITAIDHQFHQGCQIPDGFAPYPGWGASSFIGYRYCPEAGDTIKLTLVDGALEVRIHGYDGEDAYVSLLGVPIEVLIRIYRKMC